MFTVLFRRVSAHSFKLLHAECKSLYPQPNDAVDYSVFSLEGRNQEWCRTPWELSIQMPYKDSVALSPQRTTFSSWGQQSFARPLTVFFADRWPFFCHLVARHGASRQQRRKRGVLATPAHTVPRDVNSFLISKRNHRVIGWGNCPPSLFEVPFGVMRVQWVLNNQILTNKS